MENIEAKEVKQVTQPAPETPPQTEAKVNTEAPPEDKNSDGIFISQKCESESTVGDNDSHDETDVTREGVQHSEERRVASDETPVRDPSEEGETALTGLSDNACVAGRPKSRLDVSPPYSPGEMPTSPFAPAAFRRRPMCRRVLHFTMTLSNSNLNEDFELISAQILYVLESRLR